MKNILLLVHDDAGQEARFQAALDLTRALEGHLTCLDVSVMPAVVGEFDAGYAQAMMLADEQARESENRKRIEQRLAREDVPWNWLDTVDGLAQAVERNSDLADIIVVNRQLDSDSIPDMRGVASEVAIGSGKTIVAVPESWAGFETAGHAMIAWDGSDEAMNAVQAAVPLLKLARVVTLVEVKDGTVENRAEDAAAYLSRHGIKAVVVRRSGKSRPTADVLVAEAKAEGADYIVMGAFGRSRIVEAIFGGVSRAMLTASPIPIVMRH